MTLQILTCFPMFFLSVLQFLSREVKGKYELQFARAQQEIAYVPG